MECMSSTQEEGYNMEYMMSTTTSDFIELGRDWKNGAEHH